MLSSPLFLFAEKITVNRLFQTGAAVVLLIRACTHIRHPLPQNVIGTRCRPHYMRIRICPAHRLYARYAYLSSPD
jgi:hypothetical protein